MANIQLHGFFEFLKSEGFEYSLGDILNVERVFETMTFDADIGSLKYVLAPLIVKSAKEQQEFYKLFDRYFYIEAKRNSEKKSLFSTARDDSDSFQSGEAIPGTSTKKKKFKNAIIYSAILLLGLTIILIYNTWAPNPATPVVQPTPSDLVVTPPQPIPITVEFENLSPSEQLIQLLLADSKYLARRETLIKNANILINENLNEMYFYRDAAYQIKENYVFYQEADSELRVMSDSEMRNKKEYLDALIDYQLCKQQERLDKARAKDIEGDIRFYFIIFLFTIFALYEYYLYQNQQLFAALAEGRKPDYFWQFKLSATPKIIWDANIHKAAQHFRKRVKTKEVEFDVESSITSTINHGGVLDLVYKQRSRPPEYLILIERYSLTSHQASYFSFLAKTFSESDIYVHTFYYANNFASFWSEVGKENNYSVKDLGNLFPNCRLIIFGDSHELINIRKGGLTKVGQEMQVWSDRAILSPRPTGDWDYKEGTLGKWFKLLPATSVGILELVDHFEDIKSTQLGYWKSEFKENSIMLPENLDLGVNVLKYSLDKDVFDWVCMCAIFPQLFWDLTLFLGKKMFPTKNMLTQHNLQTILKIEWFQQGFIPKEYRQKLLAALDDDKTNSARKAIVEQMRNHPPEAGTDAFDEYKVNLIINELAIKDLPAERKKALKKELNKVSENADISQYTELRSTAQYKVEKLIDFVLPESWRAKFRGIGLAKSFRRGLIVVLIALIGALLFSLISLDSTSNVSTALTAVVIAFSSGFVWWVSRRKNVLSSFEVSTYWLLVTIGFAVLSVFILANQQQEINSYGYGVEFCEGELEQTKAGLQPISVNGNTDRFEQDSIPEVSPEEATEEVNERASEKNKPSEETDIADARRRRAEQAKDEKTENKENNTVVYDDDSDGVPNDIDQEANTPIGKKVDANGVSIKNDTMVDDRIPTSIYFEKESAKMSSSESQKLRAVVSYLKRNPSAKLIISGHTGKIGSESYNMKLSERRAQSVKQALVYDYGIGEDRITTKAYGSSQLVSKDDKLNDRVEIELRK